MRLDPRLGYNGKKRLAIRACQVRDRDDLPFFPEQAVRKGRNIRHVNSGADHASTFSHGAQRGRNQRADGRVENGRIERHRRRIVRGASPGGAERKGKLLRGAIASARERVDGTSLPICDLCNDMRGGAEPVQPEMFRISSHGERAPADQACAKKRRERRVLTRLAERKTVARVGQKMRGKAAVARIAGKYGMVAEIFAVLAAIAANAAGRSKPGDADAFAKAQRRHARS